MPKNAALYFLCLCALFISGCGFALRGNESIGNELGNMQLILQQPNSEISRLIRQNLEASGTSVALIDSPNQASPGVLVLSVSEEQVVSRPVTVNARARASQYELRMSVTIAMGKDARYLIEPEPLVVQRIYFEDIENITGNREEVAIISAEMRRELVNQLIRRINAAGA
ncbi:MAG: LPS assembly lipoprotein LptE [Pseudohongiellaceae bacterium]